LRMHIRTYSWNAAQATMTLAPAVPAPLVLEVKRNGAVIGTYCVANTTEPLWSRNPVCRKLTGPLSG
jgi:hypothetical protein